jgi:hypothetical protein
MSHAATRSGPRRNWTPLVSALLRSARLFSKELAPLGISPDAVYRETPSGFVVRWGPLGAQLSAKIPAAWVGEAEEGLDELLNSLPAHVHSGLEASAKETGETPIPQMFLAFLIAERRRLKIPRGANAEAASNTLIIRAAAQTLCEWIQFVGLCRGDRSESWISTLRQKAEAEGGWRSAAEITAYAITKAVDWKTARLMPPIRDGELDLDYFKKQYLDGEVTTNREGRTLAETIEESYSPPKQAAPRDPVRERLAKRISERFRRTSPT